MADSKREQIAQYLETLLQDAPSVVTVQRSRLDVLEAGSDTVQSELPAVILQVPVSESVVSVDRDTVGRTCTFSVAVVYGRPGAVDNDPPMDQAIDPILNFVEQQVYADETMGGLASEVQGLDISWITPTQQPDVDLLGAVMSFKVLYYSQRGDPTQ